MFSLISTYRRACIYIILIVGGNAGSYRLAACQGGHGTGGSVGQHVAIRNPELLSKQNLVATFDDTICGYGWTDSNHCLVITRNKNSNLEWSGQARLVTLSDKNVAQLKGFTKFITEAAEFPSSIFSLSPSGNYLEWDTGTNDAFIWPNVIKVHALLHYATSKDDVCSFDNYKNGDNVTYWAGDTKYVVMHGPNAINEFKNRIDEYNCATSKVVFHSPSDRVGAALITQYASTLPREGNVVYVPISPYDWKPGSRFKINTYLAQTYDPLFHRRRSQHTYFLELPSDTTSVMIDTAQKLKRILWTIVKGRSVQLWSTRLDGSNRKVLGRYFWTCERDPIQAQWVPGSQKVCFSTGTRLYVAPADTEH